MKPRVIAVVPSVFIQPGVLVFLRPDVLPGVTLYVISVDASPPTFSAPGWDIAAEFQGDQRITVLRRVVDGSEPSLIPMITGNNALGSSGAVMLAVERAGSAAILSLAGTNVPDASSTYTCPPGSRSSADDMVLGVVATNGSAALLFNPPGTVVHANVSDGQFASISIEIFESLGGAVVPAQVVTLDAEQPGIAATLVIPAAAA